MLQQFVGKLVLILLGLSCVAATLAPPTAAQTRNKILSRKRRYLAFPEGSSVSASICMTVGVIGNPNVDFLSWAVNWGVAYDLPNYTWVRLHENGFKHPPPDTKAVVQRRSRRDLYERIELAMDNLGFNGRACIARALCESGKYLRNFQAKRGTMIEEIVKLVFSLPGERVRSHEPAEVHYYDRVFRRARRDVRDCSAEYGALCHFSLVELALGKYTVEPTKHGPGGAYPAHVFM